MRVGTHVHALERVDAQRGSARIPARADACVSEMQLVGANVHAGVRAARDARAARARTHTYAHVRTYARTHTYAHVRTYAARARTRARARVRATRERAHPRARGCVC